MFVHRVNASLIHYSEKEDNFNIQMYIQTLDSSWDYAPPPASFDSSLARHALIKETVIGCPALITDSVPLPDHIV